MILALIVTLACGFVLDREQQELSGKLVRLHVLANSDETNDQALKLEVRDRVIRELEPLIEEHSEKADAEQIIEDNLSALENAAMEVINERGLNYTVSARLTEEFYPSREYDDFSLPAGDYTSLQIIIGEGGGANWWCVIFPPLCTGAEITDSSAAAGLTDDEISLITEDGTGYVIKFKALEIWAGIKNFFK